MARNRAWSIAKRFMWALRTPPVRRFVSREYTDYLCSSVPPRPHGFSLCGPQQEISDYVSWPSLTNRGYSARHLAPASASTLPIPSRPLRVAGATLPASAWDETTRLWSRVGEMQRCERSNVFFAFFAQWFTDSIFNVNVKDRRRNDSNHDIDLCQIYGLNEAAARSLRTKDPRARGELAHRVVHGEEYPDLLFELVDGNSVPRKRYAALPGATSAEIPPDGFPSERRNHFYATGLDRGNSSLGYVAITTLFLREHNRLSRDLARRNESWSDEQVFQTARNINTVILLKLLVEEYVNHILGEQLFLLEPKFADRRSWLRSNWMAIEFNLLYRWHGLIPRELEGLGQAQLGHLEFRYNNARFEELGLSQTLTALMAQPAGRIGLRNTADFLLGADYESVCMSRKFQLQSFNAYCDHFSVPRLRSFDDLTTDPDLRDAISRLYGNDIDRLELIVGLFAQSPDEGVLFGPLMARMVAYDALTQIYSNPLLSEHVYGEQTFTSYGCEQIESTTLETFVRRNTKDTEQLRVTFDHRQASSAGA
ncbi:MAG: hypothetical protein K0R38_5537 [Polyangiaceae bacterium]|nr:hypothetical protein [Polyangiaceae bacterium]